MKKITHERLIELAEGHEKPTVAEVRLLETNHELQAELEELRKVFGSLRSEPEPTLDPKVLASILPGVRAEIAQRSERAALVKFASWRPAYNILAVASSLLILLGLLLLAPGSDTLFSSQELLSYGFISVEQADPALDARVLQLQAENASEFELFNDFEETLDLSDSSELLDESTFDLMERATDLDEEAFALVKESFAATL